MCFVARIVNEMDGGEREFETVNPIAHVTVGTASREVKPKESNDLLQRWLKEGSGDSLKTRELVVEGEVVLQGSVKGVLSRF